MQSSTKPQITLFQSVFNLSNMLAERNFDTLRLLVCSFWSHPSQEIRDALGDLYNIVLIIFLDHQPSRGRQIGKHQLGYNDFAGAREESLMSITRDLHIILKPCRVLLKPKGPFPKVLKWINFSPAEILEIRRLTNALANLIMQERLTGYIPYMLNKFQTVREWRHSPFAKMTWSEVGSALAEGDESLEQLVAKVSYSMAYDIHIVKKWVQLGSNMSPRDTYIARCIKKHKIEDLSKRVWQDESDLESLAINDELETRAFLLAFKTFREEWFDILWRGYYELTVKASHWLSAH